MTRKAEKMIKILGVRRSGIALTRSLNSFRFHALRLSSFGLVILVGLAGCQFGAKRSDNAQPAPDSATSASTSSEEDPTAAPLPQQAPADTVANQNLFQALPWADSESGVTSGATIAATLPQQRLYQVRTGRSDPFAMIDIFPDRINLGTLTATSPNPTTPSSIPGVASGVILPPIPQAPQPIVVQPNSPATVPGSPVLSPQSAPTSSQTTPQQSKPPSEAPAASTTNATPETQTPASIAVPQVATSQPPISPPSPTFLAESLELRGVVHVGNQWQAIVKEPQELSSRTVRVGDVIAGGNVRVRQIDLTPNGTARVILEQNGIQVIRTVS